MDSDQYCCYMSFIDGFKERFSPESKAPTDCSTLQPME